MKDRMPEIMCTLTATQILDDGQFVKDMYEAGMRSVRINTAHLQGIEQLASLAAKLKSIQPDIRILIDTKGPEMRTTAIESNGIIDLKEGMEVVIEGSDAEQPATAGHIYVNYPSIYTEVKVGDRFLIDDGNIELTVVSIDGQSIKTTVTVGGSLGSRKGIAVAGVDLNLPALSLHDRMYISYAAASADIDVVAHSFVRSADDLCEVKKAMLPYAKPVIAKIENQQGIDNLNGIIAETDGILIARGDLSASIGRSAIPAVQALIASSTKAAQRPLYLATNILPSMMHQPEVSADDIAGIKTAMSQGVDVMLLTNETASGEYPLESVAILHDTMAYI